MKKLLFVVAMFAFYSVSMAQVDYSKLSSHLATMLCSKNNDLPKRALGTASQSYVLALVALTDSNRDVSVFEEYACQLVDSIGRIYIVNIPIDSILPLSTDSRIKRIEAERMPRIAVDDTKDYINATDIYRGVNLPQAFTGKGVVAGIFDCYYDLTHPAFYDEEGNCRIKYYYDFCWPNSDGTKGREIDNPKEISQHQHSKYTYNVTHGTHVASTMAGSSVNGRYGGIACESDIYLADFNSDRADFENPGMHTSATAVLGFKYLFDKAAKEQKPCVINFSSCESITLSRQRILEGEAIAQLVGPGRIIVAACGNMGHQVPYMEKPTDMPQAGVAITNGIGGGNIIDMDIVTPVNQSVRFDFLSIKLVDQYIEGTIIFNTDSIKKLGKDTCVLNATVSAGDIELRVYKSDYEDARGDVFHIDGSFPNMAYLMLYGATCLLSGNGPAWMYSDLFYSPFANIEGIPEYECVQPGYSVSWPATLPSVIAVGATGYTSTFTNIDGNENTDVDIFRPDAPGCIAKFSSLGPTFDGLIKPDVVAPGMNINAAYNSFSATPDVDRKSLTDRVKYNGKDYYYMAQSGTSMASPVVAGTIALWLEADPTLTPQDILKIIAYCAEQPDETMEYPNNTYGYGEIDAYKGLLYVLEMKANIPELYEHQPLKAYFKIDGSTLKVFFADDVIPEDSKVSISIYSMNGIKVAEARGCTVDVSQLSGGIYAIQLNTGDTATSGSTLIRL